MPRTDRKTDVEYAHDACRVRPSVTPDLEDRLRASFPMLYRNVPESGFDGRFGCDDGWEFLVRRVSARLEPLVVRALVEDGLSPAGSAASAPPVPMRPPLVHVRAVGKSFGCLTFSLAGRGITGPMLAATAFAEEESLITCEDCGAPGMVRRVDVRHRTLCNRHAVAFS